jgi:adenylate cyclase
MATDFEAEGLLDGLEEEREREARLELLRELESDGVPLDELKRAAEEGRLALLPVERALSPDGASYSANEIAERSGVDREFLDRVWRALGLPLSDPDDKVFAEGDLEAARRMKTFREAGIPDEGILDIAHVMGRSMSGVAGTIGRVFTDAFLEPGDTERDVAKRYAAATRELVPHLGPTLEHALTVHQRAVARQAMLGTEALASGQAGGHEPVAVGFADVVGFTRLGERLPPEELAALARRLADLTVEVTSPEVTLVKTIGDAAMLVSRDPDELISATLELVDAAEEQEEDFPPLHAGLAYGEALNRGGDWYGRPVNLASRITDFARPGSVVADKELHEAADGDYRWSDAGRRKFKGVKGEVSVFRVRPPEAEEDS